MSAISIVTSDHRAVEREYERFTAAPVDRREAIARRIVCDLIVHEAMEEMRLYPVIRRRLGAAGERYTDRALAEHQAVTEKLARLDDEMDRSHTKTFADRMAALMRAVAKHVDEEEQEVLPMLEEVMSPTELAELGRELEDVRRVSPTHPHPNAPKEGVAGVAANIVGKAVDAVRDRAGA